MKKLILATAVAASVFTPLAFAQARAFGGLSVGFNLNFANAANDFRANSTSFRTGDMSQTANVQLAYGFAPSDSFVLGIGLMYGPGDFKAGMTTTGGVTYELKARDIASFYLEPSFPVTNSTLAYAKVSYQGMRGETKLSTGTTESENFTGMGYGAGIRTLLGRNVYLQAEFEQIQYTEKTYVGLISKPSATVGTIGLGYRF